MNSTGELGVGDNEPRLYPILVQSISHKNVEMVSCGGSFAISTGTVVRDANAPHPIASHPPASVRSTVVNRTPQQPTSQENSFSKGAPVPKRAKTSRERSFGENISN